MHINISKRFSEFFEAIDIWAAPRKINFLVLHHVAADSINHAIQQFTEHQVSSHYVIDESGEIFLLVEEDHIAYHAGVSYWKGSEALNKNSIGIEFINSSPFEKSFNKVQLKSGLALCQQLVKKYKIDQSNIVGHSDIAYQRSTNLLDRKQDPSHLFDWKFFADNDIGLYPKEAIDKDRQLFFYQNRDKKISEIKEKLAKFGYKVNDFGDEFNDEMVMLSRVFHRRFNQKLFNKNDLNNKCNKEVEIGVNEFDVWHQSSSILLDELLSLVR